MLVLVRTPDDPEPIVAEGAWHGRIVDTPRGSGGFGYDPHFEDLETGMTGRGAAAREEECAVASRQGDSRVDREVAIGPGLGHIVVRHRGAYNGGETLDGGARPSPVQRTAAVGALHPHSVVREEVPVLRLQFARASRDASRGCVCRRVARRSGEHASARVGPQGRLGFHRRRNAEPVLGRVDRPPACRRSRTPAADGRRGGHARSQPGYVRAREVRGILRRRRQSPVAGRPELRSRSTWRRWAASTTPTRPVARPRAH